mmetsp:Transcript_1790/g.7203  ORF Transcript_1790/g.7203 Transcript_1790/m.7203 type:complete len:243 (-) Transcript_1790:1830-2558(-)
MAAVVAGDREQRVDVRGVQEILEARTDGSRAPRVLEPVFVKLPLRQNPKVKRLRGAPRVKCSFAGWRAFVLRRAMFLAEICMPGIVQRRESIQSADFGHSPGVDPLAGKRFRSPSRRAAVRRRLERGEHVQLLRAHGLVFARRRLLSEPAQHVGALQVLPGFRKQVDRVDVPLRVQQVRGVLRQQTLDLPEVVLLGERHRPVPPAQRHARVHGGFDVARAHVRAHRGGAQADPHELSRQQSQ